MREIQVSQITEVVAEMCMKACYYLPGDVYSAMVKARETEESPLGRDVLDQIIRNAEIAKAEGAAKAKKIKADADAYEAQKIAANQAAYAKQWQYEIDLEKAKRWNGKEVPDAAYIVPGTGAVVPLTQTR